MGVYWTSADVVLQTGCYACFVLNATTATRIPITWHRKGIAKNKGAREMAKLKELDLNLDVSVIPEKAIDNFLLKEPKDEQKQEYQKALKTWAAVPQNPTPRPELEKEYMSGAEFIADVLGQSLNQAHPSGNVQLLRRTKEILAELKGAIDSDTKPGVVLLKPEDFAYLQSAFDKSDKWVNNPNNAIVLCAVADLLGTAKDIEL